MHTGIISLVAIASLLTAGAVQACDTFTGKTGGSPVEMRKPVIGDEVHLVSGYGMRRHPLLQELRMHTGVDWAAPTGTPVVAAGAGRVVSAGDMGDYGNTILIDHGAGWQTLYAQLSGFDIRAGDCVTAGTPIGKVGSTGLSAGPHLHFEVRVNGQPIDPMTVRVKNPPPEAEDSK